MHRNRSASPRRGTCLRFSAAGAARNRSPLSPRHLPPRCYDRSRSRVRLSFHLPPLRHLTTRSARVRSRSQLLLYNVPGLSSEPSPEPLGGCRCALCRGNIRSVLFLRSAALTLRSLLLIPASCLSAQGITARLAAFLHTPALCADRGTERQARLAFSRSAGLAHRLSQQSADHVSLHACPARHCSAPWFFCARAFCRTESFCRLSSQRSSRFSPRHLSPRCYDRSRFRALSSFHSHALRHLPPLCFGRSRSQPSASTQAICHRDLSSSPLGGCRCALCRRNNCSVLLPPLGGSYPAQPAADPGLLLVGAGNNSTPRCPPSKSSSLHRSAPRTPCTPRCRLRLPISAPLTQLSAPIFVTVFSFLAAGSLLTYNNQLRFVTFRQTLCRLFPYGLPLGLPSRLPPRLLLHLHAIAAGRNHLQPIAGKIIQSHPVFSDFLRVISVFSSPRCPYFLAVFRFLFQQRVGTMRKTCFHKHPD